MSTTFDSPSPAHGAAVAARRAAAATLALLGLTNVVLGVLSLTTDLIRISPGGSGGLIVAGIATLAFAGLVGRGSRLGTIAALTLFGILLIVQVGDLTSSAPADGAPLRVTVLALVVTSLGAAVGLAKRPRTAARSDAAG